MSSSAKLQALTPLRYHQPGRTYATTRDTVLDDVSSAMFASLPRRDQRRRGRDYLRGLLGATGRKSIRNIAVLIGNEATEQSLHHFISSSTWDWEPVRHALARYLVRHSAPLAWVVRPMTIPKAGAHSVGVARRFCPARGLTVNAQQAVGIWAASEGFCGPVNWRLHLPQAWLADDDRRCQAAIPDCADAESLSGCALSAYLSTVAWQDMPKRPVILDARRSDVTATVHTLRRAGAPLLIRVGPQQPLVVQDPALPCHSTDSLPAQQIMIAARYLRRPVAMGGKTRLAATVGVRLPGADGQRLRLLGVEDTGRGGAGELWLTDVGGAPLPELVRLSRLLHRVEHDFAGLADQVGIGDYTGRSFTGWHRHVTLASAAHAVASLTQAADFAAAA